MFPTKVELAFPTIIRIMLDLNSEILFRLSIDISVIGDKWMNEEPNRICLKQTCLCVNSFLPDASILIN